MSLWYLRKIKEIFSRNVLRFLGYLPVIGKVVKFFSICGGTLLEKNHLQPWYSIICHNFHKSSFSANTWTDSKYSGKLRERSSKSVNANYFYKAHVFRWKFCFQPRWRFIDFVLIRNKVLKKHIGNSLILCDSQAFLLPAHLSR